MHKAIQHTSGRRIAKNTLLNLFGQGLPILIALFAIPYLIRGLGTDRFGVLTLAWALIGYFSIFDFGLGRALTKLVAEKLGSGRPAEIPPIVWTTMSLMLIFGIIGALTLGALSPVMVHSVLKVPDTLKDETLKALYLLAFSLPLVITTAGLRGILEAAQRFDLANIARVFMGVFSYLGPLLVLPFAQSLHAVVSILVLGRAIVWIIHVLFCFRAMPALLQRPHINRTAIKPLLHFGSWMTVTNTLGPLMVYLDRFLIGALVSVSAVAYYTTPYEVITKLWIIPGALVGTLLPAFSASFAQDGSLTQFLYLRAVKYVYLVMLPLTVTVVLFSREGLTLWLGAEFAMQGTPVLQLLAVGVFVNSMAQVSFVLLQGLGRPDLSAKLMMIQLPFYVVAAWWAITHFGIVGAAFVWTARVAIDAMLFFYAANHALAIQNNNARRVVGVVIATIGSLFYVSVDFAFPVKLVQLALWLLLFIGMTWLFFLSSKEKYQLTNRTTSGGIHGGTLP